MLKNIRQSLITRLMLYFLLVGFAVVVLLGVNFAFGLKVHFKNEVLPNIAQYLIYIKDDIGSPPNLIKAKKLSQDLSIKIYIKGPQLNWQSNADILDIKHLDFEPAPAPYKQFKIARRHEHNFVLMNDGPYQFYFSVGRFTRSPTSNRHVALIIALVFFMVVLFFALRRSLKPLQDITKGVKRISLGDLDSNILVKSSFEFEQLANGINTMAGDIKGMLEAKQQLLLAISHELRSPMTRAQVNLALLPEDDIQKALKHDLSEMEQLISQILESQRLNQTHAALNKTNFSFNDLIREVIDGYFQLDNISLDLSSISIHADKTRFMLLIKNLIDNAIKYSKGQQHPPSICLYENTNEIVCVIKDNGIGMQSKNLSKITQAFYRVDEARQRSTGGFGLGLYLSHLIVQAHGATMTFESKLGLGTTVKITLPK